MRTRTFLKYLSVFFGIIAVLSSLDQTSSIRIYIKIAFILILLFWYAISVEKIKPLVFLFFLGAISAETFIASNFDTYYIYAINCFTICFASGTIVLLPFLKKSSFKFRKSNLLMIFIVLAGVGYIVSSVYFLSLEQLADYTFFPIATIAFSLFIGSCFYVTAMYYHPVSVFLFLTGIGYAITCIGGLLQHFYYGGKLLMGFINACEVIAQLSFAYFMIHYKEIIETKE